MNEGVVKVQKSLRDQLLSLAVGEKVVVKRRNFTEMYVRRVVYRLVKDGYHFVASSRGTSALDGIIVERLS